MFVGALFPICGKEFPKLLKRDIKILVKRLAEIFDKQADSFVKSELGSFGLQTSENTS